MRRSAKKTIAAIISAAVAGITSAMTERTAVGQTFWNTTTGDYTVGANWSPATEPGAGATADVNNGGTCLINASDGTLSITQIWAGDSTTGTKSFGTIYQSGGTMNASQFVVVGKGGNVTGIYNMTGGVINETGNAGDGIRIFGSASAGPAATLMLVSGSSVINDTGEFDVGYNNGTNIGAGELNMSSGTINMVNQEFTIGYSNSATANSTGTTGVFIMTGGTFNLSTSQLWIGDSVATSGTGGIGTFNLSGGNVTSSSWVAIGRGSSPTAANASGTLNISGGTFTHVGGSGLDFQVGSQGANVTATLNLSGTGALITDHITDESTSGTQTINFNGGYLQANASDNNFIRTYTTGDQAPTLNVGNGGATFNTSSFTVGLQLPLIHSASANTIDGGLTKLGSGTLTLYGSNTYTGPTNVNAGILYVNGSTGSLSTVTVNSGATLGGLGTINGPVIVNSGATLLGGNGTSGTLSIPGTLSPITGSTITLGNLTSYANPAAAAFNVGSLNFSGGTVNVTAVGATGTLAVGNVFDLVSYGSKNTLPTFNVSGLPSRAIGSISDTGSMLELTITSTDYLKWTGVASGSWDTTTGGVPNPGNTPGASNWKLNSNGNSATYIDNPGDTVVFDDSATGTTNVSLGSAVLHPSSVTFNNSNLAYTLSGTGGIAGTLTTLTKLGSNSVVLDTANTYGGGTFIQQGTLQLGTGGSINSSTGIVLGSGANSATLMLGDSTGPVFQTVTGLSTSGTGLANQVIGSSTAVPMLTVNVAGGTDNYSGLIGNGSAGLTTVNSIALGKSGAGILALTASNTYTGGTNLAQGTLSINNNSALGTGNITLTGNAVGAATGVGSGTILANGNITLTNNFVLGTGSPVFNTNGFTLNISGSITNTPTAAAIIQPIGTGNLILSGTLNVIGSNTSSGTIDTNIPAMLLASAGNTTTISGSGTLSSISAGWYNSSNTLVLQPTGTLFIIDPNGPDLDVGQTGGNGIIFMNSGNIVASGNLNLGKWDTSYGSFTMNGGNATFANIFSGGKGNGNSSTGLVQNFGTIGSTAQTIFGYGGDGTSFGYLTGGTFNAGSMTILANSATGTGILTVAGGTMNTPYVAAGGSNNVSSSAVLSVNSGVLNTNGIGSWGAVASSVVNLNGGVVEPLSASSGLFLNFVSSANVYAGGAVFNSNGQNITVGQNLTGGGGSSGFNNSSVSIASPGTGYIGAPVVTITGGGGTGATAVATVSGGVVTGINITSAGTGYTSNPIVTLVGGGGSGAAVNLNPVTNANDGGVTKLGTGTLTLSGSNTYVGGTQVQGGTLAVGNASTLGTGGVTLSGGSTLAMTALPALTALNSTNFATNSNGGFKPVFGGNGNSILMTSQLPNEATSAFVQNSVAINDATGFVASFVYSHSTIGGQLAAANGITFTIEADGANSLGGLGAPLGYVGANNNASTGIQSSVAAGIDLYQDQLEIGINGGWNESTGFGTVPFISQSYSCQVTVSYAYNASAGSGFLTETVTSLANNSSYTYVSPAIDLVSILNGNPGTSVNAWIGFTAGTGASFDNQAISNFSFNNNGLTQPVSAVNFGNPITVAASSQSSLLLSPTNNFSSGSVASITLSAASTLSILNNGSGGALNGSLTVPSISFGTGSTINLTNNALDITAQAGTPAASLTAIWSKVATGYNGGNWNGSGISSTSAASDSTHLTAIGVIINDTTANTTGVLSTTPIFTAFDGAAPSDGDILVKYTYYGDANLDGKVDGSDYALIDNGFLTQLTGWFNGDFNYDGVVDGSDYTLIDNTFNSQGVQLSAQLATETAQISGTAVPEPASLGLLAIGATALLGRRRQRNGRGHH